MFINYCIITVMCHSFIEENIDILHIFFTNAVRIQRNA